jgi:hypothetical protein
MKNIKKLEGSYRNNIADDNKKKKKIKEFKKKKFKTFQRMILLEKKK